MMEFTPLDTFYRHSKEDAYSCLDQASKPFSSLLITRTRKSSSLNTWQEWCHYQLLGVHSDFENHAEYKEAQIIKEHKLALQFIGEKAQCTEMREHQKRKIHELAGMRLELLAANKSLDKLLFGVKVSVLTLSATLLARFIYDALKDIPNCYRVSSHLATNNFYKTNCPNPLINPFYFFSKMWVYTLPFLGTMQAVTLLGETRLADAWYIYPRENTRGKAIEILEEIERSKVLLSLD